MTMKTPEMEVVRFNESDVIVASGNVVASVYGFNDEVAKNAGVKWRGIDYKTTNANGARDLLSALGQDGIPSSVTFSSGHGSFTVSEMFDDDTMEVDDERSIPLFNGTYTYRNGGFHLQ